MYHGLYSHSVSINIKAESHDACNLAAARFRYLQKAWCFSVEFLSEGKSARKGDVLCRDIQLHHKGYASDIIAFGESLRAISQHLNCYQIAVVTVLEHGCRPIDGYNYLVDEFK